MKCQDVKLWLLTSRDDQSAPSALRRHLGKCAKCRTHFERLQRLDEKVRCLPIPKSRGKDEFLKRFGEEHSRPQNVASPASVATTPAVMAPAPVRNRHAVLFRSAAGVVAACILLGVGWLFGRNTAPRTPEIAQTSPPAVKSKDVDKGPKSPPSVADGDSSPKIPMPKKIESDRSGELAIMVRVMKHNNRLAESYELDEQVQVFESMAQDLRTEMLRLVTSGSLDEGKAAADLYDLVVRDALLPRAARLFDDKQDAARKVASELRKSASEIDVSLKQTPPAGKNLLLSARTVTLRAAEQIEGKAPLEVVVAPSDDGSRPLLQSLVVRGLILAGENDPLGRAELCSDTAVRFAPSVILLSAGAGADKADLVGECLNELLERGVASNLEKAERTKDGKREEAAKLREKTAKAWNNLEAGLVEAPGQHAADVKRIVGASAPGRDRVAFPGKGKGNPFKGNDTFTPPGLQKKIQKQSSLDHGRPARDFVTETSGIVRGQAGTAFAVTFHLEVNQEQLFSMAFACRSAVFCFVDVERGEHSREDALHPLWV